MNRFKDCALGILCVVLTGNILAFDFYAALFYMTYQRAGA